MSIKKAAVNIVRVLIRIGELMVLAMLGGPFQRGLLEGGRTKKQQKKTDKVIGGKGNMRKAPVIAYGNRHARERKISSKKNPFRIGSPIAH